MTTKTAVASGDDDNERYIPAEVDPGVWFEFFKPPKGEGLLFCLTEVLKNIFDWGASHAWFYTSTRNEFVQRDDGCGMGAENRKGFVSVGKGTGGGDQSSLFGTGAKYIIFTFSNWVRVVTAPEEDPECVFVFEFTPQELAEAYSGKGRINCQKELKTAENWPHEHPFGTEISYTLKDPNSRSIHRGARLAALLSGRLDLTRLESGMVLVDGERLPPKKLATGSKIYRDQIPAERFPALGKMLFEFYRPETLHDQEILMTGRAVGEVSLRDSFVKTLPEEIRRLINPIYFEKEVCGLIVAGFLNEYATHSRSSYDPSLVDDERVIKLIEMLNDAVPAVAEHLGIKLKRESGTDLGESEIQEVFNRFRSKWEVPGDGPVGPEPDPDDPDEEGRRSAGGRARASPAQRLFPFPNSSLSARSSPSASSSISSWSGQRALWRGSSGTSTLSRPTPRWIRSPRTMSG
jgi:hypothetical protein